MIKNFIFRVATLKYSCLIFNKILWASKDMRIDDKKLIKILPKKVKVIDLLDTANKLTVVNMFKEWKVAMDKKLRVT
jgi:hypothetical protein